MGLFSSGYGSERDSGTALSVSANTENYADTKTNTDRLGCNGCDCGNWLDIRLHDGEADTGTLGFGECCIIHPLRPSIRWIGSINFFCTANLAKTIAVVDEQSTAALMTAIQMSGFSVRGEDGAIKYKPIGPGQGLAFDSRSHL